MFLQDAIQHLSCDRQYEQFYPQLQTMACHLLSSTTDFESLFIMVSFITYISRSFEIRHFNLSELIVNYKVNRLDQWVYFINLLNL